MKTIYIALVACSILLASCNNGGNLSSADGSFSRGGSTAKFSTSGNYLYVIDQVTLFTYDVGNENEIVFKHRLELNTNLLETIFPFGDYLFLGSTTGVLILDISDPGLPKFISEYQHVLSCDPVVTDGDYAYVTLRSGNFCGQTDDELQILDLSDINSPKLILQYALTSPKGLTINNNILYVCDEGIRIFDVSNKSNIQELSFIPNIPANDVIYYNNQLLVTADNGFYQFDVTDITNVKQIGQFTF
ncbi:MAG: hypothetical protein L3J29_04865 [Cyclobacteriaceae bacterium]|nr:hypothetical protein [Cyclobacteriaceae bacterium]